VGYLPGMPVLRRLSLRIDNDDRIALLGANGNGKSTLLKLLAGRLALMQGRMTQADKLRVGYFAQHQLDELNAQESAYDHLRRLLPVAPEATVRSHLGAVGFSGELADTPTAHLSGGEKARLVLALAAFASPHLMILDEPANHLDIDSRAALIEAINGFAGAVILVSHDRHLLDACAERLWLVDNGTVAAFSGDLDDYHKLVLSRTGAVTSTIADATGERRRSRLAQRRAAARRRAELAPLRSRIAAAEAKMAELAADIARMDAALSSAGLFARDPAKATAFAKARADASDALAAAEAEWLDASTAYEVEEGEEWPEALGS
jgi:ATP-binding cassette subfamily F protein 3